MIWRLSHLIRTARRVLRSEATLKQKLNILPVYPNSIDHHRQVLYAHVWRIATPSQTAACACCVW